LRRVVFSCLFILFFFAGYSQIDSLGVDSLVSLSPLLETEQLLDSLPSTDLIAAPSADSALVKAKAQSEIETTINYNARDSIFFDVKNQTISMFGQTHIDYDEISLDAEKTTVNWQNQTLQSAYLKDSVGRKVGKPVFTDKDEVYETEDIVYNFRNKRAVIKGVVTQQDDAFMHGETVRKNEQDELFIRRAKYTTCALSDPHFYIESSKLKLIPGDKVISGPFVLKFRSTQNKSLYTPLALPFGMFPQPKKKVSGVVFPSYGEERRRGFFLRNGGYYWAISDYMDLKATSSIYSRGGFTFDLNSTYKKRYAYTGSFSYSFNRTITDDVEGGTRANDQWLRWSHTPQTRGRSSFSASVSAGTSSFNENNNLVNQDFQRSINSQFASNVSFQQRYRWSTLSLAARQNQNITTNIQRITLPEMTFNVNRINPFKKIVRNSKSPLSKLNLSHNFVASSEFSNAPVSTFSGINVINRNDGDSDTLEFFNEFDRVLDRSRIGGRHTVPISTSLNVLKHFTLSPSFNYQELWYSRELAFEYDEEQNGVRIDTLNGFSRTGNWRTGASLNTVVYGTYFVKGKRIEAIRHVMTPNISFNYNPDFGDPSRGVISEVQVDSTGRTQRLSKYEGFIYATAPPGESQTVSFSLQNNLEMKVRNLRDTTGEEFRKIKIFDNLSASTGYNFAADSFQLSDIGFRARTSFFKNALSINLTGNINPYIYELISEETTVSGQRNIEQREVNRFAWDAGRGIGQLDRIGTNISLSLSPNTFKRDSKEEEEPANTPLGDNPLGTSFFDDPTIAEGLATPDEIAQIQNNPEQYVDFNLPWRLSANYSVTRSKRGFEDAQITQTLAFNGSLALTPKTQVSFNSGYDLEANEFTTTRLTVNRDLHCWTLSFNVVPFGRFQSFNLTIQPRASLLQELKLKRNRNFLDSFN